MGSASRWRKERWQGLVPRADDWRAELDWIRAAQNDGVIVFEAVGLWRNCRIELRREGFNVIGGSAFGDRLENDRGFALDLLRGQGLRIAPVREFDSVADEAADLNAAPPVRFQALRNSAGETFVGAFD